MDYQRQQPASPSPPAPGMARGAPQARPAPAAQRPEATLAGVAAASLFLAALTGLTLGLYLVPWLVLMLLASWPWAAGALALVAAAILTHDAAAPRRRKAGARSPLWAVALAHLVVAAATVGFAVLVEEAGPPVSPLHMLFVLAGSACCFMLLGQALPVLAETAMGDTQAFGHAVGQASGAFDIGLAAGLLTGVLALAPQFGLADVLKVAAAVGGATGVIALICALAAGRAPSSAVRPRRRGDRVGVFAMAGGGALAGAFAFTWVRVVAGMGGATLDAYAIAVAGLLVGLGIGSLLGGWIAEHVQPSAASCGMAYLLAGLAMAGAAVLGGEMSRVVPYVYKPTLTWAGRPLALAALAAGLLGIPGVALGAAGPLAARAWVRGAGLLWRDLPLMRMASGVGSAAGVLAGAFLAVPLLGFRLAALVVAVAAAAVGAATIFLAPGRNVLLRAVLPVLLLAATAGALVVAPQWTWQVTAGAAGHDLELRIDEAEGPAALHGRLADWLIQQGAPDNEASVVEQGREPLMTAATLECGGERALVVNGRIVSSTTPADVASLTLLAHLAGALSDEMKGDDEKPADTQRTAVVGLATGAAVYAATAWADEVVVVEPSDLAWQQAKLFEAVNHGVLDRDEGIERRKTPWRTQVGSSDRRFRCVLLGPVPPGPAGAATLWTDGNYRQHKAALADGGVLAQWVPLHSIGLDDLKTLVRTFRKAFEEDDEEPNVSLWAAANGAILIGVNAKQPLDLSKRLGRCGAKQQVRRDLAAAGLWKPKDAGKPTSDELRELPLLLHGMLLLDAKSAAEFAGEGPLCTDLRPVLAFSAPRHLGTPQAVATVDALLEHRDALFPAFRKAALGTARKADSRRERAIRRAFDARTHLIAARARAAEGQFAAASEKALEAFKELPASGSWAPGAAAWHLHAALAHHAQADELDGAKEPTKAEDAYEKAQESYEAAVAAGQKSLAVYRGLGIVSMKLGDSKAAVEALREALRIEPDNEEIQEKLREALKARSRRSRRRPRSR